MFDWLLIKLSLWMNRKFSSRVTVEGIDPRTKTMTKREALTQNTVEKSWRLYRQLE